MLVNFFSSLTPILIAYDAEIEKVDIMFIILLALRRLILSKYRLCVKGRVCFSDSSLIISTKGTHYATARDDKY